MDKKKLRNDLFLIIPLFLAALVAFIVLITRKSFTPLVAKVYISNNIVQQIDLTDKTERNYTIHGKNGDLILHVHDGSIKVLESNCPHQDCVNQGEVKNVNQPIICAYNEVYIVIDGQSDYDVVI